VRKTKDVMKRHMLAAGCIAIAGCAAASRPDGVDLNPITSLRFNAGPDFLARIQRQLGGAAADWSKNGVGYLVYRLPNPDPDSQVFRSVNVFREDSATKAHGIYVDQREQFTDRDWKLYLEKGKAPEMWFISYEGVRFDTNHGIPMGLNTSPDIIIGILKQNVFIVIGYTSPNGSDYIQTINGDVAYVAELLAKAGS
jgi:hypothetical protein